MDLSPLFLSDSLRDLTARGAELAGNTTLAGHIRDETIPSTVSTPDDSGSGEGEAEGEAELNLAAALAPRELIASAGEVLADNGEGESSATADATAASAKDAALPLQLENDELISATDTLFGGVSVTYADTADLLFAEELQWLAL